MRAHRLSETKNFKDVDVRPLCPSVRMLNCSVIYGSKSNSAVSKQEKISLPQERDET